MFDDEELEQIRDEQDEWQGHVDRQTVKKSRTSSRLFLSSVGTSFVLLILLVILVSSGIMTTAALSVAGVGGFTAEIGQLNGSGINIHPALGPTAACKSTIDFGESRSGPTSTETALPQLRGEIRDAKIPSGSELIFVKDMAIPNLNFAGGVDTFRIKINQTDPSGSIQLGNASLYLTGLEADGNALTSNGEIVIENAQIREFFSGGSSNNPRFFDAAGSGTQQVIPGDAEAGEFSISGTGQGSAAASIKGATARAHFISFETLSIQNIQLSLDYLDSDTFSPGTGVGSKVPISNGSGNNCPHGNN
jgi:hypothetical protein